MNKIKNIKVFNQPVRVELSHLQIIQDFYVLNDVLFTGLAYDHRDNQLYQVYEITEGVITGSRDYGFFKTSGMVKVDIDLLDRGDFDYEMNGIPYTYNDKPFTGVSFSYLDGFVFSESLYHNSWIVKSIGYYPDGTGRIRKYEENHIDITETTGDRTWSLEFENNSYKRIQSRYLDFKENHTGTLELFFNEQNQITTVTIEGDYEYVSLLVPQDDLPLDFKTFDELLTKENIFADELSIWSIGDKLFNQWLDNGFFNQVKQLELCFANIELTTIAKLAKLPLLQTLNYQEISVYQTDLIRAEKQKQQFRAQALALYALQQTSQIKVTFTDGRIDYFQEFLPNELKQQLT